MRGPFEVSGVAFTLAVPKGCNLTCVQIDGEIENERMPWSETEITMDMFDKVREQGGYVFPEGLEKVKL